MKGISLIELLIFIAIFSLLLVLTGLSFYSQMNKGYDVRRKADLDRLKKSLEVYYSFADSYPSSLPNCGQPLKYKIQTIMSPMPCDPTNGSPYFYQVESTLNTYRLYARLTNDDDRDIKLKDCRYNYGVSSSNVGIDTCPVDN